jgi:FtsH-binding integral membrane protein
LVRRCRWFTNGGATGSKKSGNTVREWYGYLWLGFGISLVLALVTSILRQTPPVPMVLIVAGFATFMSGILIRFRPLVFGGIVLWVGAALCLAVAVREHSLVEAGAIVLGYLVPGYMLNRKTRRSHV